MSLFAFVFLVRKKHSISQSPKRLPSASLGRWCMLVLPAIFVAFVERKALCLRVYLNSYGKCGRSLPVVST